MPISRPDEDWRSAFDRMREDEDAKVAEAKRRAMRAFVRRWGSNESRDREGEQS